MMKKDDGQHGQGSEARETGALGGCRGLFHCEISADHVTHGYHDLGRALTSQCLMPILIT